MREKKRNNLWALINIIFLTFFLWASFYLSCFYSGKTYFYFKWFLFSTPLGLLSYIFIPKYWGNWFNYILNVRPLKVSSNFELYISLLFILFSIIYLFLFKKFVVPNIERHVRVKRIKYRSIGGRKK